MIEKMTSKEIQGLSMEELEAQTGEYLPDREEMSLVNANVYAPVNVAVATNVFSDHSVAIANAQQYNYAHQYNFDQYGYTQHGYDQHGYTQHGYEQYGHMQHGYEQSPTNINVYEPTNAAVATNVFSDHSAAVANAQQYNYVHQGNFVRQ